jgi:uncharacterized protein YeaO (DUF488 family)
MLRQGTVEDIKNKRITRRHGHLVAVTRFYPRYLKRNLLDEYDINLAPPRELLDEFKNQERASGEHDQAFDDINYEAKFTLTAEGIASLNRLTMLSQDHDVYLICHCKVGTRCHREILMVLAQELFQAKISKLHFPWQTFRARIPDHITRA